MDESELEAVNRQLSSAIRNALRAGAAAGLVAGLILGGLLGCKLSSDNIVVVPLEQGVQT